MGGESRTFAVPAPPTVFEGRADARARLAEHLVRDGVTVVFGRPGLGKTALIAKTLDVASAEFETVVYLRVAPNDTNTPATLAQLLIDADIGEWEPSRAANMEEALLILAENAEALVIVDSIDGTARWEPLLRLLSEYAQSSRWLFVAPTRPVRLPPRVAELELQGLPHSTLFAIAERLAPSHDETQLHELASKANGSPRVLCGLLDTPAELHADARALLGVLQRVETPIPEALLSSRVSMLGELARSGHVELGEAGWSITPSGRGHSQPPEVGPELLHGLLNAERSDLFLAGIRLGVFAGAHEAIAEALQLRWTRIRGTPQVVPAFELLRDSDHEALRLPRLRMAIDLGDPLCQTLSAEGLTFDEELDRILSVVRLGVTEGTRAAVAELLEREGVQPEQRQRAQIYAALLALWESDTDTGRAIAEALDPLNPELELRRAAVLARIADRAGEADAASWEKRVGELVEAGHPLGHEAAMDAARCLHLAGHSALALEALDLAEKRLGVPWQRARLAQQLRLISLVAVARVAEARALTERLEPFVVEGSQDEPLVEWVHARLDLVAGHGEKTAGRLATLLAKSADSSIYRHFADAAAGLGAELAILECQPLDESLAEHGELATALSARWNARHGRPATHPAGCGRIAEIQHRLADAEAAIVAGELERAQSLLGDVRRSESETVYVVDALELESDVALLAGTTPPLDSYRQHVQDTASGRYRADLDFFANLSQTPTAGELVHASHDARSHRAVRRYRALLGIEARLDVIDQRIVETLTKRLPWSIAWVGEPSFDGALVDLEARSVQRGDLVVSLARRNKPWSVLQALIDAGGHANKETLVTRVWNEAEYHPLKHDNRLQAAVSQLRKALVPLETRFVEADDEGYALTVSVGIVSTAD